MKTPDLLRLVAQCPRRTEPGKSCGVYFYDLMRAAAHKPKATLFTIDGDAVVAEPDGVAPFDLMHGHRRYTSAFLWAFDLLNLNGEDLRALTY